MLRPVGTPTSITPSSPHHMVETINEALVKTLPATSPARLGLRLGWATKRSLDTAVALTALCLLLPLLLFIALLIWASDGHAPIYRHVRLGQHRVPVRDHRPELQAAERTPGPSGRPRAS
jgi:exopolysaccharide production protein ExoY